MKAILIEHPGAGDVLRLHDIEQPIPGGGELLVRVKFAGVNYADIFRRRGTYPGAVTYPFIPGLEIAGVVEEAGPGTTLDLGTRVAALTEPGGGYAEFVIVRESQAIVVPSPIRLEDAVALLLQGLTAKSLVEVAQAKLGSGAIALVTAAAGGVGTLLVQLLRRTGTRVIAGVGEGSKLDAALQLGAEAAINYRHEDWSTRVRADADGRGVDVAFDGIGGAIFSGAVSALASGGLAVTYGVSSGELVGLPPDAHLGLIFKGQTITGHTLPMRIAADPAWLPDSLQLLYELTAEGALKVAIHPPFPLHEAAAAHRALEERRTTGKVLLVMEP